MRQHHRHGDQRVLQPLMHAQHLDEGPDGRLSARHRFGIVRSLPARRVTVGRHDDRRARGVEDLEVMPAVAGIVEAAVAIGGDKRVALAARRQVVGSHRSPGRRRRSPRCAAIALGEFARRAGGQHDLAAIGVFGAQALQQLLAIGQRAGIDVDATCDFLLQPAPAPGKPERHQEKVKRILLGAGETGLPTGGRSQSACRRDRPRAGLRSCSDRASIFCCPA